MASAPLCRLEYTVARNTTGDGGLLYNDKLSGHETLSARGRTLADRAAPGVGGGARLPCNGEFFGHSEFGPARAQSIKVD
jgi:hypothetical protein